MSDEHIAATELSETEAALVKMFRSLAYKGIEEFVAKAQREIQVVRYPAGPHFSIRIRGQEVYERIRNLAASNGLDAKTQAWIIFHSGLERKEQEAKEAESAR